MAPEPIGPYSQAVAAGPLVFCSGQIAIDVNTQVALASLPVGDQAERVINQIKAVLKEAGLELKHVLKTTIFLIDMADFQAVNEVYGRHFTAPYPARSTVAVAGLPKGVRVEIEVTALRS
jgi:2-iminobutanoate/2-iminopropanoate deaminase